MKISFAVFLVLAISFASGSKNKRQRSAPLSRDLLQPGFVKTCAGVDTCWLTLFEELNAASGHIAECKAWKRYARCLRSFVIECKDDFYYATQVRSVRIRIQQLGCPRGALLKAATAASMTPVPTPPMPMPLVIDNAHPVIYKPHLRNHHQRSGTETLACQAFGYGHLRTFGGDVMACRRKNGPISNLVDIEGLFTVKAHYRQEDLSQLQNVSVTFMVNNSVTTFYVSPSNDMDGGLSITVLDGALADEVSINFAQSDHSFSVVNVAIKRIGLKLRIRRRRLDTSSLLSVTLQTTTSHSKFEQRRLRSVLLSESGSDLCMSGCSGDEKIDLASEIAQQPFDKVDIREARQKCSSALQVENEYLTPCIFDLVTCASNSLCKEATPQCARQASNDLAAHLITRPGYWRRSNVVKQSSHSVFHERRRVLVSISQNSASALSSPVFLLVTLILSLFLTR